MSDEDLRAFRTKARTWLEQNGSSYEDFDASKLLEHPELAVDFRTALWDEGLLGITLDRRYGGQGLTLDHQRVFQEEVVSYSLPPLADPVTVGICAPTLLDFGSEEQKVAHVARMIRGEEAWTQLLSEPSAGSDLASLRTKAVRDGDEFVLNGQKVWTSGASRSDYALCIARTDPEVPKRRGLSMFIVDLKAAGVTIRPLRQMTGDSHFNEVFLDDVRVAASDVVGEENDGWRVLTAMLTHERLALGAGTGAGGGGQAWTQSSSTKFIKLARERDLANDAAIRQEITKIYILEKVLELMGKKMRDELAAGLSVGAKGSVAKLASAILTRQSSNLGMLLGGPEAQAWDASSLGTNDLAVVCLFSPMTAIAGGTSEIQRNTIGERVLGLPREPQLDRDLPFSQLPTDGSSA